MAARETSDKELELDRIGAELEAEHQAIERAALENGDTDLPEPSEAGDEPPLPDAPVPAELAISLPPGLAEPTEPAEDQDGDQRELTDEEVVLLFGPEQLEPFRPDIEQDPDYDPLTSKPAVFR